MEIKHWPIVVEIPVAWGDMDAFRHVNNSIYLRYFESARIAYFQAAKIMAAMESQGIGPILAHASIDFLRPLTFPDRLMSYASCHQVGNKSFRLAYRLVSTAQADQVAAAGDSVIVMLDYKSGQTVPIPAEMRQAIGELQSV